MGGIRRALALAACAAVSFAPLGARADDALDSLLAQVQAKYPAVFAAPATYRLELLYTEVSASGALVRHGFRVDAEYFYPASAIKLAAAVGALEKLDELGATPTTALRFYGPVGTEPSEPTTTATYEVRKALIGSDNEAFNRLYTLAGQQELAARLARLALPTARVTHRLGFLGPNMDDGRLTPRVDLTLAGGRIVTVPRRTTAATFDDGARAPAGLAVGSGYLDGGKLVTTPMSFATRNRLGLRDLQDLLMAVARPELVRDDLRPRLSEPSREVLLQALATLPRESKAPIYDPVQYPDVLHKPFLAGATRVLPRERLEVLSKGGRAYGFTIDNAYVKDRVTGRSFFLAAAIYTNGSEILNNDLYEYGTATGLLTDLAEAVARQAFADAPSTFSEVDGGTD